MSEANFYTPEQILALSTGSHPYLFDFSVLKSKDYEKLFRSLTKFAVSDVESLGFMKRDKSSADSIAARKSNYIKNMIELLYYVLPRNKSLKELAFYNLDLQAANTDRFCLSLGRSDVLKVLTFSRTKISTKLLSSILVQLNPNKITHLHFKNCDLDNQATQVFFDFLDRKTVKLGVGISLIHLIEPKMSDENVTSITERVNQAPAQVQPFNVKTAEFVPLPTPESQEQSLLELQDQNRALKNHLRRLLEVQKDCEKANAVYIAGSGAKAFSAHLDDILNRLTAVCEIPIRV